MKEEIVIRTANTEDAADIAGLMAELGYPGDAAFVETRLAELSNSLTAAVFIALSGDKVLGVISYDEIPMFHQAGRIGMITLLSVGSNVQRQGIGRALVEACEKLAQSRGVIKIAVASGQARNDAHAFYQSLGYEETTKRFVKTLPK